MNQVLLAPQFGVGRAKLREPEESSPSSVRDVPAASLFAPAAGGPQVIVKRRRVLEVPKPGSEAEQAATGPVKAPKVYQVAQVAAVAPVAVVADLREEPMPAAAAPVQEAPTATPKLRRRRDPSRQPTLVQHVVFEPAPVQPAAVEAAGAADLDGLDVLDAKRLSEALAVLDAELERVARCEAAARSLDVHLKQLRVGGAER
jgi:hypothetical protein